MGISARLRTILMCSMLEYAALMGAPMRPDEIQELLRTMNTPKIAHVITEEKGNGEK